MKARVKATGALLIVRPYGDSNFDWICDMGGETGTLWKTEQLDFIDDYEPDYWKKLKHQYAGMAIQGILNSDKILGILGMQKGKELDDMIGDMSVKIATTLVNKLKEDEQCQ